MTTGANDPTMRVSEEKKHLGSDTASTPPLKVEDVENAGSSAAVDAATEARLLRKLDIRSTSNVL